jgi:hypothetical protein
VIGGAVPDLATDFGPFKEPATVTIPGSAPVVTVWAEQGPRGDGYPADSGRYSLTKKFRRGSLRLDQIGSATKEGVSWPPPDTKIELATETLYVEGVDYQDEEVSTVIVRVAP